MGLVTKQVEKGIAAELTEKLALIFDGWSKQSTHFVGVFAAIPSTDNHEYETILMSFSPLASEASFTANSLKFKSALVKIQEEAYDSLDVQKRELVKHLMKPIIETESETAEESFAHEIIKKWIVEKASKNQDGPYMKTKFLVPTSNTVERFFSFSGYTFNDYRQRLLLEILEMQLFLKLEKKDFGAKNLWTAVAINCN